MNLMLRVKQQYASVRLLEPPRLELWQMMPPKYKDFSLVTLLQGH